LKKAGRRFQAGKVHGWDGEEDRRGREVGERSASVVWRESQERGRRILTDDERQPV
jgi:hypothetical protein